MPKVYVTEYDVAAEVQMQDRTPTHLATDETFRHEVNLHVALQSRNLVVKVQRTNVPRVCRLPILSAHINYPADYEATFEAHLNTPEVYITILHWLNATFVVAENTHTPPRKLFKQFEAARKHTRKNLPAYFSVGDLKKGLRSQHISTIPAVARKLEAA